jgi:protease I
MRVACVATDEFEDRELAQPLREMQHAGHRVDVIAPDARPIRGLHGRVELEPDATFDTADPDRYDALFVPGGRSPESLARDERCLDFVRRLADRPIFALCHGPALLHAAGLLEGRRVTAWPALQPELRRAGLTVEDAPVVIDGHLVTSRRPADLPWFVPAILAQLDAMGRTPAPAP